MSFPRYPKYKASGVEWLGEVPEHWEVSALKRHFRIVGGSTPKSETESFWDGDVLWATPSDLSKIDSLYLNDTQRKITTDGLASCGTSLVPAGSIILSTRAPIGSLAIAKVPICTNQGCKSLVPAEKTNPIYFAHLLSISSTELNIRGKGTTFLELSADELGAFEIPFPTFTEQTAIAAFLDRETGKIDGLVAEQRRLMELLKEKRQAVISHAVTCGLNPAAPMKDSGIDWLGQVPAHWRVGKAGFYLTILSGYAFPSSGFSEDDSNPKLLRGINVGVGRLKWEETVFWPRVPNDGLDTYEMKEGDLVIGMDRPLIADGIRVAKVQKADLPCLLLQRVASIQVGTELHADYLLALLGSEMFAAHFLPETTGVSVPHISPEQIHDFVIPIPPLAEQTAIVAHLEQELAKFDTLTAEAQRAIDLLQERRTALISAAVTGQIDVRGALPN